MAITRKGRLIARPNFTDLPRKRRGGPSKSTSKKRMAKADLRPHSESPVGDIVDDEDSNERLMRRMKERGLDGTNFRDRERDDLD